MSHGLAVVKPLGTTRSTHPRETPARYAMWLASTQGRPLAPLRGAPGVFAVVAPLCRLPQAGTARHPDRTKGRPGTWRPVALGAQEPLRESWTRRDGPLRVIAQRCRHDRIGNERESPFIAVDQLRQQLSA
jgi:hypothetical protein